MKNYLLKLLWFLIVGLLFTMGYFSGWWDNIIPGRMTTPPVTNQNNPSLVISGSKLTGWDGAKKEWEITAQKIQQSANTNIVYFSAITQGILFSLKGKRVDFQATWVRWEKVRRQLFIGGGFEAKIDDGVLQTAEAVFDARTEVMNCPKPVVYFSKDVHFTANQLNYNFDKEELNLTGDVELVQNKDQVKADGLIYKYKEKKYQLVKPKGITITL